ncbi:hypothetical protein BSKO_01072 [Bryopsis sp. KO-2023]|nr:hypothetical protein BSKO_01072 [Bryopsis sp. KO-2023]
MAHSLVAQFAPVAATHKIRPSRQQCTRDVAYLRRSKTAWIGAVCPERRRLLARTRQAAVAAAEVPSESTEGAKDVEDLWRTLDKNLSIGKSGLQPSHVNMLRDVLASRHVAKVKFGFQAAMEETAEKICQETGAQVLMVKGATVLFGGADVDSAELNAKAKEYLAEKKKKFMERRENRGKMEGMELPASVSIKIKSLADKGILNHTDFDRNARRALAGLPEVEQVEILSGLTKKDLKGIKNRSAWLTSRIKVHLKNKRDEE